MKQKYNFGTHKQNEQRIYSPVQILNAKNVTLGLPGITTFGHDRKKFETGQRVFGGSEISFFFIIYSLGRFGDNILNTAHRALKNTIENDCNKKIITFGCSF